MKNPAVGAAIGAAIGVVLVALVMPHVPFIKNNQRQTTWM